MTTNTNPLNELNELYCEIYLSRSTGSASEPS